MPVVRWRYKPPPRRGRWTGSRRISVTTRPTPNSNPTIISSHVYLTRVQIPQNSYIQAFDFAFSYPASAYSGQINQVTLYNDNAGYPGSQIFTQGVAYTLIGTNITDIIRHVLNAPINISNGYYWIAPIINIAVGSPALRLQTATGNANNAIIDDSRGLLNNPYTAGATVVTSQSYDFFAEYYPAPSTPSLIMSPYGHQRRQRLKMYG